MERSGAILFSVLLGRGLGLTIRDMKERERFIWQILLQLLPSFIPAALAVLIGTYREVFPSWAFFTLLVLFTGVLTIALVRLVLGDLLYSFYTGIRRSFTLRQRRGLVFRWAEKWGLLTRLAVEAIEQQEPPGPQQEEAFQALRRWFSANRAEFLPLWERFVHARTAGAHERWSQYDPRTKMFSEHWSDPFSVIYQAATLKEALLAWGLSKGGVNHWLNEFQDKTPFKQALQIAHERLNEWIGR